MRLRANGNRFKAGLKWYRAQSRAKQIILGVLALHAFFLLALFVDDWMSARSSKTQKIAVKTVQYIAHAQKLKALSEPAMRTQKEEPKRTKKLQKPKLQKPPAKPAPAKKSVVSHDNYRSLVDQIQKNIDAIAEPIKIAITPTEIALPSLVFEFDTVEKRSELGDAETIALFLQDILQLPEFGEVRAKIAINCRGELEELQILDTKSVKNSEFLKKRLPEVQFPCLNDAITLTIVFRNET